MKSLLIAASVAAMTIGGAAYAGSGSSGSSENPQANPQANTTPGSSATSGGSMQNPAGNRPGAYQSGPATGPASGPWNSSPPQSDSYGSGGTTPEGGPGAVPRQPRHYKGG